MDFWRISVGRRDESSLGSKALIQSNGISFGVDKVLKIIICLVFLEGLHQMIKKLEIMGQILKPS